MDSNNCLSYLSSPQGMCRCTWRATRGSRFRRSCRGCCCRRWWGRPPRRSWPCSRWGTRTGTWGPGLRTWGRCKCHHFGTFVRQRCKGSCTGSIRPQSQKGSWKWKNNELENFILKMVRKGEKKMSIAGLGFLESSWRIAGSTQCRIHLSSSVLVSGRETLSASQSPRNHLNRSIFRTSWNGTAF